MKILNIGLVAASVLLTTNAFASASAITCSSMGLKGLLDTQTAKMPDAFLTLKMDGGKSARIALSTGSGLVTIDVQRDATTSEIKENKRDYAQGQIGIEEVDHVTLTHFETRFDAGNPVGTMLQQDGVFIKCGI